MAYDAGAAYEPPQRAYYGKVQQPQRAPVHNAYRGQEQEQYAEFGDPYAQEYEQPDGQDYGYEREAGPYQGRAQQYDDGGYGGYGGQPEPRRQRGPPNGYEQPPMRNDRQYEPRYQQRPDRGRPPQGYDQQQRQPRGPSAPNRGHGPRGHPPPGHPHARMPPPESQRQRQPRDHRGERPGRHPQDQGYPSRPSTAPHQKGDSVSSQPTMEEWKALERAKMQVNWKSPDPNSQDNVFPSFGANRGKSRPPGDGGRQSEEQMRPSTSNGHDGGGMRRPNGKGNHFPPRGAEGRPPLEQDPHSFGSGNGGGQPAYYQEPGSYDNGGYDEPAQGYGGGRANTWDNEYGQQMQHAGTGRGPNVPPIHTQQSQLPRPPYMDNNRAMSPAQVPQRPNTAGGARAPPQRPPLTSPTSAHSQGHATNGYSQEASTKPWAPQPYAPAAPAPAANRDDEIEAEMPDFDSAAPGGTSLLHKRKQSVDKTEKTPAQMPHMPPQQLNLSAQSLPAAGGFEFGFGGDDSQQKPYGAPQRGPPPQSRGMQYPPNGQPPGRPMNDSHPIPYRGPSAPPQQTGYGQRMPPPNGRSMRGPPLTQQRPYMERDPSDQSVRSAPGQFRAGSAPPGRQQMRSPPGQGPPNGMPPPGQEPDRKNSNPDALPHHPVPVRPGLANGGAGGTAEPSKPPPIRNHGQGPIPSQSGEARKPSVDTARPVTQAELNQLRSAVASNPQNQAQTLLLAKKLVEAANVLASDGGRADPKTTLKNREAYVVEAHKHVKKLAAANYPDAQFYLADAYGQGLLGLAPDTREAFSLYQAAAKAGHGQAAFRTAICCEIGPDAGGGTRKDIPKALQWYRHAAALGEPGASFKLGMIALKGLLNQPRHLPTAIPQLQRAADQADADHPHALHELALLHESANTQADVRTLLPPNDAHALQLFQRAAGMGLKSSQHRLGQAHEYGHLGLSVDHRASIALYSKAAAQGHHEAELALSGWYLTGAQGVLEQSDQEAYLWARKAAGSEPPLAKAMFAMGWFTEMGIGCPASLDEGRRWYGRAASCNFPKAKERLEELKRGGGKGGKAVPPSTGKGKLTRRDQKRDEAECSVM